MPQNHLNQNRWKPLERAL